MSSADIAAIRRGLRGIPVLDGVPRRYLVDETETRCLVGNADAIVIPRSVEEVRQTVAYAYRSDLPVVPRGGGTGYAGGAVPNGGLVLSLEALTSIRSFDPLFWRMHVDAGVVTAHVRRLARENGLYFPPDPGAAELSQVGGNVATNAGGPHAYKYGVTGAWVTGIEAVVPPGEVIHVGGVVRKDVAGYDLKHLLIGSEGTLGVITGVWLRLMPAPETTRPLLALFDGVESGCEAIEMLIGAGVNLAALEYIDEGALACAPPQFVDRSGRSARFAVLVEVDGPSTEVQANFADVIDLLENAVSVHAPSDRAEIGEIWRWRESMTAGVTGKLGGKVSEDIVVPVDHLAEAISETVAIGRRHGLQACSWGHAGDGNLHSTFLIRPDSGEDMAAAADAIAEIFMLAGRLGGSISGEHGIGLEKSGFLEGALGPKPYFLHTGIKKLFDPKGLMNPDKKK